MAQRTIKVVPGTVFAFSYTPGDHHRYLWDGGPVTTVERMVITDYGNGIRDLDFVVTGDRIPMAGTARTASAFMDAVDRWRADR